jgi:hypothetical protein
MGLYFLIAGILARMLIPWLVKVYESQNGFNWEWKYLRGQAISVVIIFIALPLLLSDIKDVVNWAPQAAFLAGYGAAEIGGFVDKKVENNIGRYRAVSK